MLSYGLGGIVSGVLWVICLMSFLTKPKVQSAAASEFHSKLHYADYC